eukprot:CAMPEP_0183803456 /NCGR_PEP_ID=MMETSP0803_2-20130417/33020_1 /TAXON_ID=195967 /ORGANISM="Crustomastix stigmata, Strain CCMP3273" /LENGTH=196 /DNA_ID=CAMNT_0026048195 /DNA_START=37 /DNA_END=624 /DNA_ORIENTATION=-
MADCHIGSARKLIRQGGELVAVAHPVKKTGYKAPNAYGAKAVFAGETTNNFYNGKVRKVGEETDKANKKLMPYYPNASRNRPAETMENTPGQRFGFKPTRGGAESYRGSSQVKFTDADPESKRPWETTYQVFNNSALSAPTVGQSNQGIAADVAAACTSCSAAERGCARARGRARLGGARACKGLARRQQERRRAS